MAKMGENISVDNPVISYCSAVKHIHILWYFNEVYQI